MMRALLVLLMLSTAFLIGCTGKPPVTTVEVQQVYTLCTMPDPGVLYRPSNPAHIGSADNVGRLTRTVNSMADYITRADSALECFRRQTEVVGQGGNAPVVPLSRRGPSSGLP